MTNEPTKRPSVSVIIPVYNDQTSLDKCLRAIQQQTIATDQFEVIIVDNGSEHAMQNLAAPELNHKIINCTTKGSYAARNMGVQHSVNSIIAFLDADCLPIPKWLANGVSALQGHPDQTIIGGEVTLVQSEKPTLVEQYQCLTGFGQQINIKSKRFSATANIFVKRADFGVIGPFDERLLSGGDREWSWRAHGKGYNLAYGGNVIVTTPPRKSLRAAIVQARRVTGGRHHFHQLGLLEKSIQKELLSPQRASLESVFWLLKQSHISLLRRIKIIGIASLLKLVQVIEKLKLDFGTAPERS